MPPIAPKTSGVENTNIDAISDAVKTMFRFDVLDRVARMPRPIPISAAATAPQPRRRSPRIAVESPSVAATMPTTIGHRIERSAIGGSGRPVAVMGSGRSFAASPRMVRLGWPFRTVVASVFRSAGSVSLRAISRIRFAPLRLSAMATVRSATRRRRSAPTVRGL